MKAPAKAMKPAMKVMKVAMKAMKVMKAMKATAASKVARGKFRYALVLRGTKEKTAGGLTKDSLTRNSEGKIVNKSASVQAKKAMSPGFKNYFDAVKKARKELGVTGFCAVGGKTEQGKALYAKVKAILGK